MMATGTCVIGLSYLGLCPATFLLLTLHPSAAWTLLMRREYRFCVLSTVVVWDLLGLSDLMDAVMLAC
jgi:hypothetical protein